MSDEAARAQSVHTAAVNIRRAAEGGEAARLAAIERARTEIGRHVLTWEAQVQTELLAEVRKRDKVGWPPCFVALAGMGHLEKPLKRLLGFWVDAAAGHGLARPFLLRLARRAGAHRLAEDLVRGAAYEVHAEAAVDESSKMPDLLVKTAGGALLLENKLGSGESGDQYGPYLHLLRSWAAGVPEHRALLCTRRPKPIPDGWDGVVLHQEMAHLFRSLVVEPGATVWAKISALSTAEAFEEEEVGALRKLLRKIKEEPIAPQRAFDPPKSELGRWPPGTQAWSLVPGNLGIHVWVAVDPKEGALLYGHGYDTEELPGLIKRMGERLGVTLAQRSDYPCGVLLDRAASAKASQADIMSRAEEALRAFVELTSRDPDEGNRRS